MEKVINTRQFLLLTCLLTMTFTVIAQEEPIIKGKSNKVSVDFIQSSNSPMLAWIYPAAATSASIKRVSDIKIGIKTSTPVASIKINHNGEQLPLTRGFGKTQANKTPEFDDVLDFEVNLKEGSNIIEVAVFNEGGGSTTESRTINFAPKAVARTDYALLFATDDYDDTNWNDLSNPVSDATAIAAELEQYYGYKVELITNPSRNEINLKLREYSTKSYQPGDQLFIFFAGHGKFDDVTRIGYLVCKDSKSDDVIGDTYIDHSRLRDLINNIPVNHIFLTIDACFGGTFDQSIARAGTRGGAEYFEVSKSEFIERKLRFKTRKYLTSGGKEYVPDGRPGMHSPFTRKFLEALRNYGGSDGILTYSQMVLNFLNLQPEPMTGDFGISEPGSDFVFVSK